jgi:hypothetical protein
VKHFKIRLLQTVIEEAHLAIDAVDESAACSVALARANDGNVSWSFYEQFDSVDVTIDSVEEWPTPPQIVNAGGRDNG